MNALTDTDEYLEVERAEYASPAFDRVEKHLREAVECDGVQHVAYYHDGIPYLGLDVLACPAVAAAGRRVPIERRREEIGNLGRQLNHVLREIEEAASAAGSGPLIHSVLDVGTAAVLYNQVSGSEYLVSVTFAASALERCGRAMAAAVREIRRDRSLSDNNQGGFNDIEPSGERHPLPDGLTLAIDRSAAPSAVDDVFVETAKRFVNPERLHYAAAFQLGSWTSSVDAMDASNLQRFFGTLTPMSRRDAYQDIGRKFQSMNATLDGTLRGVMGGRLVRTVLDVEEGAIYFERVNPRSYFMGVTLDQQQVHTARQRFNQLMLAVQGASPVTHSSQG